MKKLVLLLALSTGCRGTSSTEVGVRTTLIGILEARGTQETYAPGGLYFVMPFMSAWTTLPINQQNLLMNANPNEGDRPVPDDITFKTKDGNNVYIDVNVMWRIDPQKAGFVVSHVGQTMIEIQERIVRPISRSIIRDVFNRISSEEYYQVAVKNKVAADARAVLEKAFSEYGVLVDTLQVQQHRFDLFGGALGVIQDRRAERSSVSLLDRRRRDEKRRDREPPVWLMVEHTRPVWSQRLVPMARLGSFVRAYGWGVEHTRPVWTQRLVPMTRLVRAYG